MFVATQFNIDIEMRERGHNIAKSGQLMTHIRQDAGRLDVKYLFLTNKNFILRFRTMAILKNIFFVYEEWTFKRYPTP